MLDAKLLAWRLEDIREGEADQNKCDANAPFIFYFILFFVLFLLPPQKRMRVLEVISFVLATSLQLRGLLAAISRSQSRR